MDLLVTTMLGNAAVAIALALTAILASGLRRPALAHALWLLVIVKLITPPIARVPVAFAPAAFAPAAPVVDVARVNQSTPLAEPTATPPHDAAAAVAVAEAAPNEASPLAAAPAQARDFQQSVRPLVAPMLTAAWIAGSTVAATLLVVRVRRFHRLLKRAAPADAALMSRIVQLSRRVGLRRAPHVRVMRDAAASPMLYWAGRAPLLLLPESLVDQLAPAQLDGVVAHELAHLRRRDHWVRALEVLATLLLWWHPLLWLARRGLREAEEQCCDAWVVSLFPHERRAYADTLVEVVNGFAARPLPPAASGLGHFKHLRRRLVMIMSHDPRRSMSPVGKLFVAVVGLSLLVVPTTRGQQADAAKPQAAAGTSSTSADAKDAEISELRERIKQLEARLEKAEAQLAAAAAGQQGNQAATAGGGAAGAGAAAAANPNQVTQAARDALRRKARARAALDAKKYQPEQLAESEQLYQVANKNWRTPEGITSLKQMVEKYPDVNRTGCAVLYLGQMSQGDTREQYLKQAVDKHSDCFYFNGVQVGGFARYLLAHYYAENNKPDEAKKLFDEIIAKYPDSITHGGDSLVKVIQQERAKE